MDESHLAFAPPVTPSPLRPPETRDALDELLEGVGAYDDLIFDEGEVDPVTNKCGNLRADVSLDAETQPLEEHPQRPMPSLAFNTPANVFDELRELDSTSEWAQSIFPPELYPTMPTLSPSEQAIDTLSDYADTGSDLEDRVEGASGHTTYRGEAPSYEVKVDGNVLGGQSEDTYPVLCSESAFRELQARCKKLEADLAKNSRDLKSAQHSAVAARKESERVTAKYAGALKEELSSLRYKLNEKHKSETSELQKRLSSAVEENAVLTKTSDERLKKLHKSREKIKLLLDEQTKRNAALKWLTRMNDQLQHRCLLLWGLYADQKSKKVYYRDEYVKVEKKWKADQKAYEDLIAIGVAVRLRYLEQAKFSLNKQDPKVLEEGVNEDDCEFEGYSHPNRAIIDKGNAACHEGNAKADAALFILGYISDEDDWMYSTIYAALYGANTYGAMAYPEYLRRIRNCQATIRALVPAKNDQAFSIGKATLLDCLGDIYKDLKRGGGVRYTSEDFTDYHFDVWTSEERIQSEKGWIQYLEYSPKAPNDLPTVAEDLTRKFVYEHRRK